MARLSENIRRAVREERYIIGRHANERIRLRRIAAWQILSGLDEGIVLEERPDAEPNPAIEVEQRLADGTRVKVIWSWLAEDRTAKLVTVHFFDGEL
jgi:hypothetical protein